MTMNARKMLGYMQSPLDNANVYPTQFLVVIHKSQKNAKTSAKYGWLYNIWCLQQCVVSTMLLRIMHANNIDNN